MRFFCIIFMFISINVNSQDFIIMSSPFSSNNHSYERDVEYFNSSIEICDNLMAIDLFQKDTQLMYQNTGLNVIDKKIIIDLSLFFPIFFILPDNEFIDDYQFRVKKSGFSFITHKEDSVYSPSYAHAIIIEDENLNILDFLTPRADIMLTGVNFSNIDKVEYNRGDFIGYTSSDDLVFNFSFFNQEKQAIPILVKIK